MGATGRTRASGAPMRAVQVRASTSRLWVHRLGHGLAGAEAFRLCAEVAAMGLHAGDRLILDLAVVESVDASGMVALVRVTTGCARGGVDVELWAVQPQVQELLAKTGLDAVVELGPVASREREGPRAARATG